VAAAQNPTLPKAGTPAPPIQFERLLQAPSGAKASLAELHGKVVVLEFWATWCAPCVAEIPVLNQLQAATDPSKVVFLAVDDQDAAKVQPFLKTHPMAGWIGIDTQGKTFRAYGVDARPATIIIGPDGRVASSSVRPEQIHAEQLTMLAEGRPVTLGGPADPAVAKQVQSASVAMMQQQGMRMGVDSSGASTGVSVSVADLPAGTTDPDTHIFPQGPEDVDITDAPLKLLLSFGAGIPSDRMTFSGTFPATFYNLHVHLGKASEHDRMEAVLIAVKSATGIGIERKTATEKVLLLKPLPGAKVHLDTSPGPGMAGYDSTNSYVRCMNATMDESARAFSSALKTPVVNETGLPGKLNLSLPVTRGDVAALQSALESQAGLTFSGAERPVEGFVITPK
jgi:thiol-disulfide isomerase/thioredoxin